MWKILRVTREILLQITSVMDVEKLGMLNFTVKIKVKKRKTINLRRKRIKSSMTQALRQTLVTWMWKQIFV